MPQWMALNINIYTEDTKWDNEFKNKEHIKLKRKLEALIRGIFEGKMNEWFLIKTDD